MATLLDISETIFYFLASFALIMIGILMIMLTYYIWRIINFLEKMQKEVKKFSFPHLISWIFKKGKTN